MKWTKTPPKVSGYYWLNYDCGLKIVKVRISTDPEWPDMHYLGCGDETEFSFPGDDAKWSGPIKPPKG